MKKRKKSDKGFSMVELLVVVAIMAVLTAIIVPTLIHYAKKSREQVTNTNLDTMERELNDELHNDGELTQNEIDLTLAKYGATDDGNGVYGYAPKKGVSCTFTITNKDGKIKLTRLD